MSTSAPAAPPSASPEVPLEHADYGEPRLECDIVMKGGITSGVVYPLAVCELAKTYRFRCIGGTSAGAIAAAATAAAEYGRRNGGTDATRVNHGFRELARLPFWLGRTENDTDRSNLFALFQPQPGTEPIFHVATSALGDARGRLRRVLGALLSRFPLPALLGALPGLAVAGVGTQARPVLAAVLLVVFGLVLAVGAALGMAAWRLARQVRTEVPGNGFGLCSGNVANDAKNPKNAKDARDARDANVPPPALTPWLADLLNDLAGKPRGKDPLTFGDLWDLQDRKPGETDESERAIDLRFMTTSLTHGRPYELPFTSREFYYDPEQLRTLFPGWVVDWMEAKSRDMLAERREEARKKAERKRARLEKAAAAAPAAEMDDEDDEPEIVEAVLSADAQAQAEARAAADAAADSAARQAWEHLLPLPAPEHLPVVVGARMSLSFPVLISAVPLYAVDYTRTSSTSRYPEQCWFSDGGICSNFPVHFFDAPLPARPTFAINLRPYHPDHGPRADEGENSWMPSSNKGGQKEWWTRLEPAAGWGSLGGFLGAIVSAMQNWVDNTQLRVPGYRDRVVHVSLDESQEGGLNLNMPESLITRLGIRGQLAARKLARRFDPAETGAELTWDNHRWVRLRSSMELLEDFLRAMEEGYRDKNGGQRSYEELVKRGGDDLPRSYRWASRDPVDEVAALDELMALGFLGRKKPLFQPGAPNPTPELRIRPRL